MAEQGIFGPTPEQLAELRRQQTAERSAMAARVSPSYSAGFGVGNLLSGVVGTLFNIQDPAIAKASKIQSVLKEVNSSLTDEERANPALQYARVAQRFAQEEDLQNESMQAQQLAQQLGLQFEEKQAAAELRAQQALKIKQENEQEAKFRTALSALPMDASDDDYYNVAKQFGTSKDIIASIDKRQLGREAREAKAENLQTQLNADLQRSRERNETLLQQARLQGANATQLEAIRQQGRLELEALEFRNNAALEQIKAQNKALNAGVPKDVAQAAAELKGLDFVSSNISNYKTKLENGEIIFSPKENAIATSSLAVGYPTKNALAQNEVKRIINEGVNELLLKAKGTQTEGDAQRARELYIDASSKNSTDSWKAAMDALLNAQNKLKTERQEYIKVRGYADKVGGGSNLADPLGIRK